MNKIISILIALLSILDCVSSATRAGRNCYRDKLSVTLIPVRYTAYNLAVYKTVIYVYCPYFPYFSCAQQVERTRRVASIQTRLEQKYVLRRIPICCNGYKDVPGTNLCEPKCDGECQNGGICHRPNQCICRPQYQGTYCEQDVNECDDQNRCAHECTNEFGHYFCSCNRGYYLHEDLSTCEKHSIKVNSFKATPKTTESVRLDWQIVVEPLIEDISHLIRSISMYRIDQSDNSRLTFNTDPSERSATIFGLKPNSSYVFELNIETIHGDMLTSELEVITPDKRVQCDIYYSAHQENPCGEGSVCEDSSEDVGYTCECLPGFAEPECENINECATNPCENGGSCVDGVNDYNCICSSSRFLGKNCSERASICRMHSSPCNGHGECIEGEDNFTCSCSSGFEGEFCEREINHCTSQPCQNGATCTSGDDGPICECESNFSGELCEFKINPCLGNDCNDGVCFVDLDRNPVCVCDMYYTGERCEIECRDEASEICICDSQTFNGECRSHCLEEVDSLYELHWPNQTRGSIAQASCTHISSTLSGNISRPCLTTARWGEVNSSLCSRDSIITAVRPFANCSEVEFLTAELWNYTHNPRQSGLNYSLIDNLFEVVARVAKFASQEDCSIQIKKDLVLTLSNLLNAFSTLQQENKNQMKTFKLFKTIEDILTYLTPTDNGTSSKEAENLLIEGDNLDYISTEVPIKSTRRYTIDLTTKVRTDVSPYLSIPTRILEDNGISPRVNVLVIKSGTDFNVERDASSENVEIISNIVSVKISNMNQTFNNLTEPIEIGFEINEEQILNTSCAFLDDKGVWSGDGVELKLINSRKVVCNAYHLSIFAVIRMKTRQTITSSPSINISVSTTKPQAKLSDASSSPSNTTSIHSEDHPTNVTSQKDGVHLLNIVVLIGSTICTILLAMFIIMYGFFKILSEGKRKHTAPILTTFFNLNDAIITLTIVSIIGFNILLQVSSQLQPILCFVSRALLQYSFLILICSVMVEMVITLFYLKFAEEGGNMPRAKLTMVSSLIATWGIPAVITLLTSIPMSSQYSHMQPAQSLSCGLFAAKGVFYTIVSFLAIAILVILLLIVTFIICLYKMCPKRGSKKRNFLIQQLVRSCILTALFMMLILILPPSNFLFNHSITSYIFCFYQFILAMVLLAVMLYMDRETFKFWTFKDKFTTLPEEMEKIETIPPISIKPEINDEGDYVQIGEMKIDKSHFLSKASLIGSRADSNMTMTSNEFLLNGNFHQRTHSFDIVESETNEFPTTYRPRTCYTLPRQFHQPQMTYSHSGTMLNRCCSPQTSSNSSTHPSRSGTPVDMVHMAGTIEEEHIIPTAINQPYPCLDPYGYYAPCPVYTTTQPDVPVMVYPTFFPSPMQHVTYPTHLQTPRPYLSKTPIFGRRSFETNSTLSQRNHETQHKLFAGSQNELRKEPKEEIMNTHPKLRRLSSSLP